MNKFILVFILFIGVDYCVHGQSNISSTRLKTPKKDTATIILPDILVKRDTLMVVNYNKGTLISKGSKKPATYFKSIQEYSQYFNRYFDTYYGDENDNGDLLLSFIVEPHGCVTNVKILKSVSKEADREVKRSIKAMKMKWNPAMNRKGKPIRTIVYLEFHFDIIAKVMKTEILY